MTETGKGTGKTSFIMEARREQIIEAAIQTLDEIGYVNASLSQIARRAGISTALILYHFADKNDLMNHVLASLVESSTDYVMERVEGAKTPGEKLDAFISASLAYQCAHPARMAALVEIMFNARTTDNVPYYKLGKESEEDDDRLLVELKRLLQEGQRTGEFGPFQVDVAASVIRGAISEYMLDSETMRRVPPETYRDELQRLVRRIVSRGDS